MIVVFILLFYTPGNCVEVQGIKQSFMWKTRRCDEKYPHVKRAICQVMVLVAFLDFFYSFNFFYFCCCAQQLALPLEDSGVRTKYIGKKCCKST